MEASSPPVTDYPLCKQISTFWLPALTSRSLVDVRLLKAENQALNVMIPEENATMFSLLANRQTPASGVTPGCCRSSEPSGVSSPGSDLDLPVPGPGAALDV